MSIERTNPVTGTELARREHAQKAVGDAAMGSQEIHTAVDAGGWVRLYCQHRHIGGYYHHGVVASAAAMCILDHPDTLHACLPGDTCHRSDTDLLMVCISGNGLAESDWIAAGGGSGGSSAAWGSITGTLADQTDLAAALNGRAAAEHTHAIADVSGLSTALAAAAPLASPEFTGTPTAPTPDVEDDSTTIATTEFVQAAVAAGAAAGWSVASTPPTADYACSWVSDGDANGVLYKLGTALGTGIWVNPHTLGAVVITPSSSPSLATIVCDRQYNSADSTGNAENSYIQIDLGSARVQLSRYTIQNRSTDGGNHMMVNWVLEASDDAANWTTLHTGSGTPSGWSSGSWAGYTTSDTTWWRYFRWRQVGTNSSGAYYFCPGEIELYGTLRASRLLPAGATGWMSDGAGHYLAYYS